MSSGPNDKLCQDLELSPDSNKAVVFARIEELKTFIGQHRTDGNAGLNLLERMLNERISNLTNRYDSTYGKSDVSGASANAATGFTQGASTSSSSTTQQTYTKTAAGPMSSSTSSSTTPPSTGTTYSSSTNTGAGIAVGLKDFCRAIFYLAGYLLYLAGVIMVISFVCNVISSCWNHLTKHDTINERINIPLRLLPSGKITTEILY